MPMTKRGLLPNAYRFIHIAADGFEDRILKGRLYHESWEGGRAFGGLSEMIMVLEKLFDEIHYPVKSVDYRNFSGKYRELKGETGETGELPSLPEQKGKKADFTLHVKYRYNATWQGTITNLGTGERESFLSLMELMDILAVSLGSQVRHGGTGLGKRMCEVTVRNYEGCQMGGDVSHPAVSDRRTFINEFDLKEEIAAMLDPLPEESRSNDIIIPRSFHVAVGNYGPATFVVRILFRRNATWQGTVRWKEKRSQVNFRSFMELLLLMQEAVGRTGKWIQEERDVSV